jgi:hypothetical protein
LGALGRIPTLARECSSTVVKSKRTLLKSAPELWGEVSDPTKLQRHLCQFKDVQIVSKDPESVVTWRADTTTGEVHLAPSGWGTQVTLIAQPADGQDPQPESSDHSEDRAKMNERQSPEDRNSHPASENCSPSEKSLITRIWTLFHKQQSTVTFTAPTCEEPSKPAASMAQEKPASSMQTQQLDEALTAALDSLGAAHHRPFSRTA